MTVQQAIHRAECFLRESRTPEGELDPRWQAIIEIGAFIESHPEDVWGFVLQWGRQQDPDLRAAIATCLLEHLLEYHFDEFFPRVEQAAMSDASFGDTVLTCWVFGQTGEAKNNARFDRLKAKLRARH